MILTIILPAFKRPDLVEQGLKSIQKQKIHVTHEIIVLNDGVEDTTKEICEKYKKTMNVRYFFTGQRNKQKLIYRCPSFAINIGAQQARGNILLLTSPEIHYLTSGCLNEMVSLCTKHPKSLTVPEFGYDDQKGIATKRLLSEGTLSPELELLEALNVEFPFSLMLHKEEFFKLGGYDEDFIGYCYDDADLINRLTMHGVGSYQKAKNHKIIHLFHGLRSSREGLENRGMLLNYNRKLYNERKEIALRNIGREWGKLEKEAPIITESKTLKEKETAKIETRFQEDKPKIVNRRTEVTTEAKERENKFTKAYYKNEFQGRVSKSGTGSDLENVNFLIPKLIEFFNANNIKSLIDAPCGDMNWMPQVLERSNIKDYKGYDIVPKLIEENKKKYPLYHFEQKDIVLDGNFGKADLLFSRDFLVHCSFKDAKKFIQNFFYSNIQYLLTTTFTNNRTNCDFPDKLNWYPINLQNKPFYLPEPRLIINEEYIGNNKEYTDKSLGLWKKIDLINHIQFI